MCRAPDLRELHGESHEKAAASPTTSPMARSIMELRPGEDDLWKIHGRVYDLTPFLKQHPGGAQVLLSVRGSDDLTAIFESNHAFADRTRIDRVMSRFYVRDCEPTTFFAAPGGFYRTVTELSLIHI